MAHAVAGECVECGIDEAALRLGFVHEGVKRWDRVVPASEVRSDPVERSSREGDSCRADFRRHAALLGLCWDDWEGCVREKVRKLMKPRKINRSTLASRDGQPLAHSIRQGSR